MAVGGYKAGTIYLDVVATYEGIQDKARRAVRKAHEGIDKEAEKAGQKSGEAFAKAEAEELSKQREKLGEQQLSHHKGVNRSMVVDSEKAARQMQQAVGETTRAHEQGAARIQKASRRSLEVQIEHLDTLIEKTRQRAKRQADEWVAATDKGAREAIEVRQKETTDALREVERRKAGLVNVLKDEYAERDALMRDWGKAWDKHYAEVQTEAIQTEKDITKAAEDEAADRIRLGEEMAAAREAQAERRRQAELQEAHYREKRRDEELAAEKKYWDDYAISAEHAERERAKQHLAMLEEAHEMDKVFNGRRKLMLDEAYAMDRDFNQRKKAEHLAMLNEAHAMNRAFDKKREEDLDAHLGVVGRMIRKSLTGGVDSIAKIKVDADTGAATAKIQDIRAKMVALRDAKVGVDMDLSEFQAKYAVVRTELEHFSKTHKGQLRLESTKALAEMKNVNREIDQMHRKARIPVIITMFVKRIDPRGDKGGLGDDGANAFRIFNPMVLLAVTALSMIGPAAAVAAAGIATLAGAAVAGGAALGVLALGLNGVFQAVQDQIKADEDSSKSSQQSAQQRARAARTVQQAKERLADAERDAAKKSADAARGVADAERTLVDARKQAAKGVEDALKREADAARGVKDAQRTLVDARREAAEGVKSALAAQEQAEQRLADAQRNVGVVRERVTDQIRSAIDSQISAEQRLADAHENVRDTRERVADQIADAIERQADAERRLEDSQRSALQAQRDLTEARREARREIEDLSMSYRESQLAEREAANAITLAQERLNEVRRRAAKGDASSADVRAAQINVDQARLRAEQQRTRRQRAGQDSRRATRRGVEGSDRVRSAQDRVRSAEQQVVDAQRNLAKQSKAIAKARTDGARQVEKAERQVADAQKAVLKAQRDVMKARRDGARQISDAERGVGDAQRGVADAQSGVAKARADGARRIADAERGVGDAQRALAEASRGVGEARAEGARRVEDAERGLSDALTNQKQVAADNARAIRDARRAVVDAQEAATMAAEQQSAAAQKAKDSMADLSPAGREFAKFILGLRGEFKRLRDVAQAGMLPGLMAGMKELGVYKAGFTRFVGDMSKMWGDFFEHVGREMTGPTWRSFFKTMGQDGPQQAGLLNRALFNVVTTIAAIVDAFSPLTTEMLTWLEKATAGWADWAAGLKGSPGFERFLDYVRRVAPEVKDFFVQLGRAMINLGIALAPFGEGIMNALTGFFRWIADMDPKQLGTVVTLLVSMFIAMQLGAGVMQLIITLMTPWKAGIALVVTALTLLALWTLNMYQTNEGFRKGVHRVLDALRPFGQWLSEHLGTIIKWASLLIGFAAAGLLLWKVVGAVMAVRKAMQLLGLTMKLTFLLNPYVLAIAAFIGVVIYLWKTNESFRDAMKAAWGAIKGAIGAVVGWFVETAWPAMKRAFSAIAEVTIPILQAALRVLGEVITWLWENVVHPYLGFMVAYFKAVFRGIAAVARWLWREVLKPVFQELGRWIKEIVAPAFSWLWKNVIKPVFRWIGAAARYMWNEHIKPAFNAIRGFIRDRLGPAFRWLWKNVVKPVFRWIKNLISNNSGTIVKVMGGMRAFIRDKVGPVFRWLWKNVVKPVMRWIKNRVVDNIKAVSKIFSALRKLFREKIGPVFQWLWKKGVRPAMRGIRSIVKWAWDKIKVSFDKMRDGVKAVRKGFKAAKDGIKDIWSNLVDVIKDPISTALRWIQKNFIDKINSLLDKAGLDLKLPTIWSGGGSKASGKRDPRGNSGGLQARADGGIIQGPYRGARADNVLGVSDAGVPIARVNPREYITRVSSTEKMERNHPGALDYINKYGELPGHATGGLVGLPRYAKGGAVYKKMAGWVRKNLPGVQITSGYRPGAITATGNKSNHGKGKALDLAPSMSTFNKILKAFGGSKILELIYSPAGGRQISKGRRYNYPQPTRGDHWDHVHWAMNSMKGGGFGGIGGVFDAATQKALDWITDKGKGIVDKIPGKSIFTKMSKSVLKKVLDGMKTKVEEEGDLGMGGDMGSMPAGKAVGRWRSTVQRALKIMNQPLSLTNRVLNQIRTESGGNPRAINKWDSNAKMGIPSKGLLQTIDPTYRAYAHPKYNKGVYHPLSNILASMRYAISRYGSLKKAYRGVGYAKGTNAAAPGWSWVGEEGPELVRFRGGEQVATRNQSLKMATAGMRQGNIAVYVENPWTGEYHEARMRGVAEDYDTFNRSIDNWRNG